MAWEFYVRPQKAGIDFWQDRVIIVHEELKYLNKNKNPKRYLNSYIDNLYQININEFNERLDYIEKLYQKKENKFFDTIKIIFKNYSWPKGKYICYGSIFDFGPRFLTDKSFQVFLYSEDKDILFTIFHEMTHFIFYDYCQKKFPEIFRNLNTESGVFWEIAELFNSVMVETRPFIDLHGYIQKAYYPKYKAILPEFVSKWKKNKDIDEWVQEIAKIYKIF